MPESQTYYVTIVGKRLDPVFQKLKAVAEFVKDAFPMTFAFEAEGCALLIIPLVSLSSVCFFQHLLLPHDLYTSTCSPIRRHYAVKGLCFGQSITFPPF